MDKGKEFVDFKTVARWRGNFFGEGGEDPELVALYRMCWGGGAEKSRPAEEVVPVRSLRPADDDFGFPG